MYQDMKSSCVVGLRVCAAVDNRIKSSGRIVCFGFPMTVAVPGPATRTHLVNVGCSKGFQSVKERSSLAFFMVDRCWRRLYETRTIDLEKKRKSAPQNGNILSVLVEFTSCGYMVL